MGNKPSRSLHERAHLLVYGYIHDWNKKNIDCKIPEDLIKYFIIFFQNDLKFDTAKVGRDLYFENDDKIVKIKEMQFSHEICLVNQVFSDKICSQFDIKYIVRHTQDSYAQLLCDFGYLIHDINDENIEKLDFESDGFGGATRNEHISAGFTIVGSSGVIMLHDTQIKNRSNPFLKFGSLSTFKSGDIIKLSFSFKQNKWEIYHNDNFIDKISLHGHKRIIPGVGLKATYCWIEIFECKLY